MKLSIVVPVYGVEQYVEKCLLSLLHQDLSVEEYEIIVINDGSKDSSWDIVKRISDGHSNIRLFEQSNSGLSATRNRGISMAQGEYLWFVDSDDYIEECCLSDIYNYAKGFDLLVLNTHYNTGANSESVSISSPVFNNKSQLYQQLWSHTLSPAQFYIYRTDFLREHNLSFYEGAYHEDMHWTPRVFSLVSSFSLYNKPVYYFYKRPNSITTTFKPKRLYDVLELAKDLYEFAQSMNVLEKKKVIVFSACKCIYYGVVCSKNLSSEERNHYVDSIRSSKSLMEILNYRTSLLYWFEYQLLNCSSKLFIKFFDWIH